MKQITLLLVLITVFQVAYGAKKALVIGNGSYPDMPLRISINDANLVSSSLVQVGFEVTRYVNLSYTAFSNVVCNFSNDLDSNDEVVFYYSGHALQANGVNYLLPVGEYYYDETDLRNRGISLDGISQSLGVAKITMIFLDASREHPYHDLNSGYRGLAMSGASGNDVFIMYSTEAGAVTSDNTGDNSLFTASLCRQVIEPGLCLDDIATLVTAEVREASYGAQQPWKTSSLSYKYYFDEQQTIQPLDSFISAQEQFPEDKTSGYVNDRRKPVAPDYKRYDPKLGKHLNVMSINEFLQHQTKGGEDNYGQFVTRNSIGFKQYGGGIEGFWHSIWDWTGTNFSDGGKIKQYGAGLGMPDPNVLRAFVYGVRSDFSELSRNGGTSDTYSGIRLQLAKRFNTDKQLTELGVQYEYNDLPGSFPLLYGGYIPSYFPPRFLDWTPNKRFYAYILATSILNRYNEPNEFQGLGSSGNPLLIANTKAYLFITQFSLEEHKRDNQNYRDLEFSSELPINFSNYAGMDIGGSVHQTKNQNTGEITETIKYDAGLRVTFVNMDKFRFMAGAKYQRIKRVEASEYLILSTDFILNMSHHLAITFFYRNYLLWELDKGISVFQPGSYLFGSSIALRL